MGNNTRSIKVNVDKLNKPEQTEVICKLHYDNSHLQMGQNYITVAEYSELCLMNIADIKHHEMELCLAMSLIF